MSDTLGEALQTALQEAGRFHEGVEMAPAAVLWTDTDGQWEPVVKVLQERMPELLVVGDYAPEEGRGPAAWVKCVLARTVKSKVPAEVTPVVYVPGVSRQTLRAGGECPELLQSLVELQYRGVVWVQRNGKDWTVEAFLKSEDALGLDVGKDTTTREAIRACLSRLVDAPLSRLRGRRLEADDFQALVVDDAERDLLEWINDPEGRKKAWKGERWKVFCARCKSEYGVDPEKEGVLVAAEYLGQRKDGKWEKVWSRLCEAPTAYSEIPTQLAMAQPQDEIVFQRETWPSENEKAEEQLRQELEKLLKKSADEVCQALEQLEAEHGERRKWLWVKYGKSPLAVALAPLLRLARATKNMPEGRRAEELAEWYVQGGFAADGALLDVLSAGENEEDKQLFRALARIMYLPWARMGAVALQQAVKQEGAPAVGQKVVEAAAGECILFCDGLRYDLGVRLQILCEERGLRVKSGWRWSALPSVTATAKPAVSPLAGKVEGPREMPMDFRPSFEGKELTHPRLQGGLVAAGYEIIFPNFTGNDQNKRAWTEFGTVDKHGHALGIELAGQLEREVERVAERVARLLRAGWKRVRVVTDHGWLLMPGGLPKVDLPGYLVESRWARCAVVKGESKVTVPQVPWHWNSTAEVAVAPEVSVFRKGVDYAHGGVSLQECVIPVLIVEGDGEGSLERVKIEKVEWAGLRCRVLVKPAKAGIQIDLRMKIGDAKSSLVSKGKATEEDGWVSMLVTNEDKEGDAVNVVIVDDGGKVLAKRETVVGG